MSCLDRRTFCERLPGAFGSGKEHTVCVERLGVNPRAATLEILGNLRTGVLQGHNRPEGCGLRSQVPHMAQLLLRMCGTTVNGELPVRERQRSRWQFFSVAAAAPPEHTLSNERLVMGTGRALRVWRELTR
jgi:hypothetical protein